MGDILPCRVVEDRLRGRAVLDVGGMGFLGPLGFSVSALVSTFGDHLH